jgi:hypothetical protein
MPDETTTDYNYFMMFCKSNDYTLTIFDYCARAFPNNTEEMTDLAINNEWWRRRLEYVNSIKDLMIAGAQTAAAGGVNDIITIAKTIQYHAAMKMKQLIESGVDIGEKSYKDALAQYERASRLIIQSAGAMTKGEIKTLTAISVGNFSKNPQNQLGAVFSKEWDG